MSDLRTAAQQALEALKKLVVGSDYEEAVEAEQAMESLRAALAQEQAVTDDMRSAVRWAPSSAYWSERLREFFGPNAREGIDALERRLAEAQELEGGGNLPPPLQAEPDLSRCPQCNGPADNGHDRSIPPSPYLCTQCMGEPAQEQAEPVQEQAEVVAWMHPHKPDQISLSHKDGWLPLVIGPLKAEPAQEQAEPTPIPTFHPSRLALFARACRHPEVLEIMADCADCVDAENSAQHDNDVSPYDGAKWRALAAELRQQAAEIRAEDPEIWPKLVCAPRTPPRRTMVPLTEQEIMGAFHAARNAKLGASQDNSKHRLSVLEIARLVEKASWEKNHGQA